MNISDPEVWGLYLFKNGPRLVLVWRKDLTQHYEKNICGLHHCSLNQYEAIHKCECVCVCFCMQTYPLINVLWKNHRCMLSPINNVTFKSRQCSEGQKVLTFKTEKCARHSVRLTNWHIFHTSVQPETAALNKSSTGEQRREGQTTLKAYSYSLCTIQSVCTRKGICHSFKSLEQLVLRLSSRDHKRPGELWLSFAKMYRKKTFTSSPKPLMEELEVDGWAKQACDLNAFSIYYGQLTTMFYDLSHLNQVYRLLTVTTTFS